MHVLRVGIEGVGGGGEGGGGEGWGGVMVVVGV